MGMMLCMLTAISFRSFYRHLENCFMKTQNFFALMLLAQAGMMGVFWRWMPWYFISLGTGIIQCTF